MDGWGFARAARDLPDEAPTCLDLGRFVVGGEVFLRIGIQAGRIERERKRVGKDEGAPLAPHDARLHAQAVALRRAASPTEQPLGLLAAGRAIDRTQREPVAVAGGDDALGSAHG
jgi:hypothetical protein